MKHDYESQLKQQVEEAKRSKAPNYRVLQMMYFYTIAFSKGYMPVRKKNPRGVLTWKNDAHLDRLLALNEKINAGATLDSLRADMAEKEQEVRSIERTLHSCGDSDSEAKDKLNIALQFAQQELKEAADWVTTAEQVLGGTYLQDIGNLERQRRETEYLPNGLRPADDEPMPQTSGAHRRR